MFSILVQLQEGGWEKYCKKPNQLEIQGSLDFINNSQISLFSQRNGTGVKQK